MKRVRLAFAGITVAAVTAATLAAAPHLALHAHEPSASAPAQKRTALAALAHRRLAFEANRGQVDPRVQYLARGGGYTAALTPQGVTFDLTRLQHAAVRRDPLGGAPRLDPLRSTWRRGAFSVTFAGANGHARAIGLERQRAATSYFTGPRTVRVPNYARVAYRELYDGIDLVYHGNQQRLEYDWVVKPGADPSAIRLGLHGGRGLTLLHDGGVAFRAGAIRVVQPAPHVYQLVDGSKRSIAGKFVQTGAHELGFSVGRYDTTKPLVIDPTVKVGGGVVGGGMIGTTGTDAAFDIAVDPRNPNRFDVIGFTSMPTAFPHPAGFVSGMGQLVIIVVEITIEVDVEIDDTAIIGAPSAVADGITIDVGPDGTVFIGGQVVGGGLPTPNGFDSSFSGGNNFDAWLGMLSGDLSELLWGSYLGGTGDDELTSGFFADNGDVGVEGYTPPNGGFPLINPLQQPGGGPFDAFLTVFPRTGGGPLLSTVLGGGGNDALFGVAQRGNTVFIGGGTTSTAFGPGGASGPHEGPFLARSIDGGRTWSPVKIIPSSSTDAYISGDGTVIGGGDAVFPGNGIYPGANAGSCTNPATCRGTFGFFAAPSLTPYFIEQFIPPNATGSSSLSGAVGSASGVVFVGDSFPQVSDTNNFVPLFGVAKFVDCPHTVALSAARAHAGTADCPQLVSVTRLDAPRASIGSAALARDGDVVAAGVAPAATGLRGTYHGGSFDAFVVKVDTELPPPTCECQQVDVTLASYSDFHGRPKPGFTQVKIGGSWSMTCSPGQGSQCEGRIEVTPPAHSDIKITQPKEDIECKAACSPSQPAGVRGKLQIVATSNKSLDPDEREGKTFVYHVKRFCLQGGAEHALPEVPVKVVYNNRGLLNKSKSDLNGNGVADGKEQKSKPK